MRRRLLEVLADPVDGSPLTLVTDETGDPVVEGLLVSESGASYPVARGVPRFVPSDDYAESFGLQWTRFSKVQLDSFTGASYSRRRFDAETAWDERELKGHWVLDAGCGAGRFAEIAASYGAEVLAVDLSSAVEAVQRNLGHLGNVHVVQADLRRLPLRREFISHLYSLGVLQHTPDPPESARTLVEALPPGGKFAFTIYGRRRYTKLYGKYWLRPLTRRMRPARLLAVIEKAMPVLFPVTSFLFRIPFFGRLFQFVIPVANYVDRHDLPREVRYAEAVLDTFDMLAPAFDRPITAEELTDRLSGVAGQLELVSRVPVIARGQRA